MKKVSTKQLLIIYQPKSKTFSAITGQKYEPASNEVIYNKVNELCRVK